jgi:hypothetical protein
MTFALHCRFLISVYASLSALQDLVWMWDINIKQILKRRNIHKPEYPILQDPALTCLSAPSPHARKAPQRAPQRTSTSASTEHSSHHSHPSEHPLSSTNLSRRAGVSKSQDMNVPFVSPLRAWAWSDDERIDFRLSASIAPILEVCSTR